MTKMSEKDKIKEVKKAGKDAKKGPGTKRSSPPPTPQAKGKTKK